MSKSDKNNKTNLGQKDLKKPEDLISDYEESGCLDIPEATRNGEIKRSQRNERCPETLSELNVSMLTEELEAPRLKRSERVRLSRLKLKAEATLSVKKPQRIWEAEQVSGCENKTDLKGMQKMKLPCKMLKNAHTTKQKCMNAEKSRQYNQKKKKQELHCGPKRKQRFTPEKLEVYKSLRDHRKKILEESKQKDHLCQEDFKRDGQTTGYNEQILTTRTSEDLMALRKNKKLKRVEENKEKRKNKKKADDAIISKASELLATSQNQELSSDEKEVLKLAEEIKAQRLREFEQNKRYVEKRSAETPPEEKEAYRLKCLEAQKKSRRKKREKQNEILRKSNELLAISQHREMSADERELLKLGEQVKAERLRVSQLKKRNRKKREKVLTPEQKLAAKLKRQEREKQIRAAKPGNPVVGEHYLEYYSAVRLKRAETEKRSRERRREKAMSTLKKANELLAISQNREMSSDEKEVLRLAEEIRARRLRIKERKRKYRLMREAAVTPEEKEAVKLKKIKQKEAQKQRLEKMSPQEKNAMKLKAALKQKHFYQRKQILMWKNDVTREKHIQKRREGEEVTRQEEFRIKNASGCLRKNQVQDEIKIEKEVLQETTIKAIPVRQCATSNLDMQLDGFNDSSHIQQRGFHDSFCSFIQLSGKSLMTSGTSKSHIYFQPFRGGSSSIEKSFAKRNGHSTKLDCRKSRLEKSFHCMRVLIDVTAKRDTHAVFGKEIAQKIRFSKKDEAEVNVAKLLIDNILQNLISGVYNSEKMIK